MAVRVAKRIEGQFHDRCGKEVKLSQPDRKNATTDCRWVRNYIDVMVFSSDPLILGGREKMFRVKAEPICPDTNETVRSKTVKYFGNYKNTVTLL